MLDALKKDTDVLFYNVFGIAEINNDNIRVSAYFTRAGRPHGRILTEELDTPLKNFQSAFIIPFGAWVDGDDVHVAYPTLAAYDDETFKSNLTLIDNIIKKTVATLRGSIE